MSQDEKYTAVIIGIASDAAKALAIWEVFRKLFLDYADEVIEALTPIAEAMSIPCLSADELEKLFNQVDENSVTLTGTSPKKHGMPLQKRSHKATMHYNYIPRIPKNLPYQRRAY